MVQRRLGRTLRTHKQRLAEQRPNFPRSELAAQRVAFRCSLLFCGNPVEGVVRKPTSKTRLLVVAEYAPQRPEIFGVDGLRIEDIGLLSCPRRLDPRLPSQVTIRGTN
ncbi:hypothetical protein D3C72_1329300 [compost metagenome]